MKSSLIHKYKLATLSQEMGTTAVCVRFLLLALLSGASAQIPTINCSLLEEAPNDAVFVQGGGGCFDCVLGSRSPLWQIELDGSFTAINGGQEPDDCDCMIEESRLCFRNVGSDIAPSYRCQIQEQNSANLVECRFQVELARLPVFNSAADRSQTVSVGSSAVLTVDLSDRGLPSPNIEWFKDNTPLTLGGRFTMDSLGSLTITDVQAEDRGAYQVTASNTAGTVPANYMLFVNYVDFMVDYEDLGNGDIRVTCTADGWPLLENDISLSGDNSQGDVQVTRTPSMYSVNIIAAETFTPTNCVSSYTCRIILSGASQSMAVRPCDSLPAVMITSVDPVTQSSATVHWTYNRAASFTVIVTGPGSTRTLSSSTTMITLMDLVPATMYTVEVQVAGEPSTGSTMSFTTVSCPSANITNPIRGVTASIITLDSERTIRLTWKRSADNEVFGYRLYVEPCVGEFPCTPTVSGHDSTSYEFPTSICDGRAYSFRVQAINECGGGGPNSSSVTHTCELINRLVDLEAHSTAVVITWDYVDTPSSMSVSAELVASPSANQLRLLTYNDIQSSLDLMLESACIQGLETDSTYEVCLRPTFSDSSRSDEYCDVVTTRSNDAALPDCLEPSASEPTSQAAVIENWQIAVIVVGGLAIVAMVFCLVGLCFACQSSKQKVDFGSNSSLNTTYNTSSINGVSMHQRSVSPPSRSCLSYHTKGHSTNWSDHVDTLRQMETDTGTHV